ncbi:MAG: fibrobacter succinogenes major paralogous domain-containing protein [Prevotellaceae bacterium]|jgi:uncharacterized protein (TIGR02145 family)|nr:fibrobacter succinogenes major paralogous domain-containing protein [Prevotellaceae bacterium]
MKKYFLIALLFPLWGVGGISAQVTVSNMATDYPASKVSFTVTWTAQPYNNQIWMIVDYIKVQNASTAGNTWKRALVTAVAKNTGTGSVATVTGQRGFWLNTSGSSGSANVTATLSLDAGVQQFNWCAYALNYPPEAKIKAGGGYDLYGTPPFTVDGVTLPANATTYAAGVCIASITDATDNPAGIIPAPPGIQLSAGSSSQTATVNAALPALKYTTTNASGATLTAGSFPTGVSGAWAANTVTISGAPSATGTFTYTVTTTNSNGCTNASVSGKIVVNPCVHPDNACTWSCGSQVWSGMLRNPAGCSGASTMSTDDPPSQAQYKDNGTTYGYYYNWTCVHTYASTLCPSPWRVPDQSDFDTLISCAGGSNGTTLAAAWGLPGNTHYDQVYAVGTHGFFWSVSEYTQTTAYRLAIEPAVQKSSPSLKQYGMPVRCVK